MLEHIADAMAGDSEITNAVTAILNFISISFFGNAKGSTILSKTTRFGSFFRKHARKNSFHMLGVVIEIKF